MVLGTLINHPELLNRETLYELRGIVARYPYFQTARLLMLSNLYLLRDPYFGAELRRSVLYVSDRRALCRLIEGYTDRVVPDAPTVLEEPTIDRTVSLIDAFLGTLSEDYSEMSLVPDAVGDYATRFLMGNGDPLPLLGLEDVLQPSEETDDSVSRALELMSQKEDAPKSSTEGAVPPIVASVFEEEVLDENYFTETLAKIYIKQRKYSRALEIIRSLYLQFPEKNAYFADQIRFLEKLIINNNLK